MRPFDLLVPRDLPEALDLLQEPGVHPVLGATDVLPLLVSGQASFPRLIDLSRIAPLAGIHEEASQIHVGAATTHAALEDSALIRQRARPLAEAAATVGGRQIRNRGSLGGNIAHASPAADTLPALLALGAVVVLQSRATGERRFALEDFLVGPGQTSRRSDELIVEIVLQAIGPGEAGSFLKLGLRNAQAIALVSAAAWIARRDGRIVDARIALGAVAPTAVRCRPVERALIGQALTPQVLEAAGELAAAETRPIDDIRARAAYRRRMAAVLVRRSIQIAWARADLPA